MSFSKNLHNFRQKRGLSQKQLADLLGVRQITILRWENSTSKPSPLAAEKLNRLGLEKLNKNETKHVSIPRSKQNCFNRTELRKAVPNTIKLGKSNFPFDPSPYVINGPEDQLPFFRTLYKLQEQKKLPVTKEEYGARLSLVKEIPSLGVRTAQAELEASKSDSTHWNPNYGSHGWHRYVGRFPPHLIRAIINHFGAKKGDVICDPFAGSGTTLVEARLLGMRAIGIDVCPLSCLITRTKSMFPTDVSQLEELLDSFTKFYVRKWHYFMGKYEKRIFTHKDVLGRRGNTIPPFPNHEKWLIPQALLGASIVVEYIQSLGGYNREFLTCAFSSCMRSVGNMDVDVVRAEYSKKPREFVDVLKLTNRAIRKMIEGINKSVATHRNLMSSSKDIKVIQASLLDAQLGDKSIDFIITSPPYGVEAVSYLRTHLLSYRSLYPIFGLDPYSHNDRVIGSEYVNEKYLTSANLAPSKYSKTFRKFFEEDSQTLNSKKLDNRRNMMMGFFYDMVKVSRSFKKWLVPGGKVAFIIGNKKLGDRIIPINEITTEIFNSVGLQQIGSIKHKLKCNNSNSEVPWQEKIIQDEYILFYSNS